MSSWRAVLAAIVSALLCIRLAYVPYGVALGKVGSGWETWPDYTQVFVAKQTAVILLPEIIVLGIGWSRLVSRRRAFFGYALMVAAPVLGAVALFFAMRFI